MHNRIGDTTMTARIHPEANRITIPLKGGIKVIYDNQEKTVEVINGTHLETIQEAPAGYTLSQFMETINRVKDYFNEQ